MEKKLYEVGAKCGHVGKGYYVEKTFAIKARDAKEAAAKVRQFPRVKHHHKDAIRYVELIDKERYIEIRQMNSMDPYMLCRNVQEQNLLCDMDVKMEESKEIGYEIGTHLFNRKKTLIREKEMRREKRYMNLNSTYGEYVA